MTDKVAQLVAAYTEQHGRAPSNAELFTISQEATLATRRGKAAHGETQEERLARWERQTREKLAHGLVSVARSALDAGEGGGRPAQWTERDIIERALDRVGQSKATWSRSDLTRAISDVLPGHLGLPTASIPELLERLTDRALGDAVVCQATEPTEHLAAEFRLADGRSAYQRPGAERYATSGQIAAEYVLANAGITRGAAALSRDEARAVVDRFAENGKDLGADQRAAVMGVLSSGARLEVLAAPAGAGKSFVVGAISEAWQTNGGRLLGLTPSQVAAEVLVDEGVEALNLARWRGAQQRLAEGRPMDGDEQYRIREGDLLVVDEAGMAATHDLADVVQRAEAAGAKVLMVGDPRQLAAVGPGGALADVGARAATYELTEVRRFSREWEGEASLRLRNADPAALEQYDKAGHIRAGGTPEQAAQEAGRAWLADTVAGRDALLLVGDNEQAAQLSAQLRAELVRLGRVEADGLLLGRDGTTAGVGDRVQARRNGWDLLGLEGNERAPINREVYQVTDTHADGSMTVVDGAGVQIRLSADYVRADTSLAYASTVHAAQGRTVDTCHAVVDAAKADAAAVYVGLTRGRHGNTAWTVTRPTVSDAPVGDAQNVKERAPKAVLSEVLERAEAQQGAVTARRDNTERDASTWRHVDRLADGIATGTAGRTAGLLDSLVVDGVLSPTDRAGLAADQAMGAVDRLLRSAEVAGQDPQQVLRDALDGAPLTGARAPAQVLHARIRDTFDSTSKGISSYRDLIPRGVSGELRGQLEWLADAADTRRHELGMRAAEDPPKWALDTLGPVPTDPLERIDWERRAGWAAAHRENMEFTDDARPLGAAPAPGLAEKRAVWVTAHDALRLPDTSPAEDAMTDGRLRARVAAYEREKAWAPRWVADELAKTAEEAAAARVNAELWSARGDLQREALDETRRANELERRQADLEAVDRARAEWYLHTVQTRDAADRARITLEARGVDVDDPGDKVTADEWLTAERTGQEVDEPAREIREDDIDEHADDRAALDAVDDGQVETQTDADSSLDIRDTAERDPSQDVSPAREVPDEDTTAAAVARARDAIRELQAREVEDDDYDQPSWVAEDDAVDDDYDADVLEMV